MSTYLLPQPVPLQRQQQRQSFLSAHRLQVPPTLFYSYTSIRDSNHDNLVCTQTSSLTYLVLQLYLHQRQQPRQSCQQADFSPTYLLPQPHPETATTTILSASRLPVPPIFSHSHTPRQQPRQSCQQTDFQSHLPCSTATPPSKSATTTILSASRLPVPPTLFYSYTSIKVSNHDNLFNKQTSVPSIFSHSHTP